MTAHILGGAVGKDAASGVVDYRGRLFGYENAYVVDGSIVSANLGVNPRGSGKMPAPMLSIPLLLSLALAQPARLIAPSELEQAKALLRDAQAELEPQQYEMLQRELGEAEAAFQQVSRLGKPALEVVRGAEALTAAQRVEQIANSLGGAVTRAGPLLVALALLWPASTATAAQECPPQCVARRNLEASLRKIVASSQKVAEEINASTVDTGCSADTSNPDDGKCTGQLHHAISKRIWQALEANKNLRGKYQHRDPRFATLGKDLKSHCGWFGWHKKLDNEIAKWINDHPNLTQQKFEAYLREMYRSAELRARFPNGI